MADELEPIIRKKKRRMFNPLRAALSLIVVFAVAMAGVYFYVYKDDLSLDTFRRFILYFDLGSEEGDAAEIISFDFSPKNRFAPLRDGLSVVSPDGVRVFGRSGGELLFVQRRLAVPAAASAERITVAYDRGGTGLVVLNERSAVLELSLESPIISVTAGRQGGFALTAEERGCKAAVTVYSASMQPKYKWFSSDRYVLKAALSPDGEQFAAACYGLKDLSFVSSVAIFNMDKETYNCIYEISDEVIMDVGYVADDMIAVVTDKRVLLINGTGETLSQLAFGDDELYAYSLEGSGFASVILSRDASQSRYTLCRLSESGAAQRVELNDSVGAVSSAGEYTGVVFGERLKVFDEQLKETGGVGVRTGVAGLIMRADKTALIIYPNNASLYRGD